MKNKCLYVSGFQEKGYVCNPGNWDSTSVSFIVKNLENMKDNEVLKLPDGWDLDIIQLPLAIRGINVYIQRNRKSGKVRLLILRRDISDDKRTGEQIFNEIFRDENNEIFLDALYRLGATDISAKLRKNILDSTEYTLKLQLLNKQKQKIFD